ncbi:hypothetical protein ACFFL4_09420 [Cellulomonas denverensis]|uniref:hypothetical protein n=1 Tax=Cellulomonas denverensis TaxID=264297 RepID=UPI0035E5B01B
MAERPSMNSAAPSSSASFSSKVLLSTKIDPLVYADELKAETAPPSALAGVLVEAVVLRAK